uniref:NADH-ubiquinone oxidoreductase chain 6 n=1 Tax=Ochthebius scopuli TaxID=2107378 RepID=A0A7H0DKS2_9COLE|nr:NADH dehydrogenase subunit 6 [Ochthebius scopuli]QNP09932.1 NADH dehydrogenase subunit 6 [Ochthebius scopuli]
MLFILLMLNIILSVNFMFMMHPLSMGLTLLMQTILITLITGFMNFNFWFSYILFLIMIGGMLVLFIYMTSIASNEKFKFNIKLMILLSFMMIGNMIIYMMIDKNLIMLNNSNFNINTNINYLMMSKFYNTPSNKIMFMMIIYLLITLIAVVKITDFKSGPLRQKF